MDHPLSVKPSEVFQKLTEWKFHHEENFGEFPLFDPEIIKCSFMKCDIEEMNESINLISLKDQYNKRIEEFKRDHEIRKVDRLILSFNETNSKAPLEIIKTNGFLYYKTPDAFYCISFFSLIVGIEEAQRSYSDESLFVFGFPKYVRLYDASICERNRYAHKKFEELISKIEINSRFTNPHIFALFNYDFHKIGLHGNIKEQVLPYFKAAKIISINTKELNIETVRLINKIFQE